MSAKNVMARVVGWEVLENDSFSTRVVAVYPTKKQAEKHASESAYYTVNESRRYLVFDNVWYKVETFIDMNKDVG